MKRKESNLSLFVKGIAIGAANVIPGVSGGTIALITGIYERLINAIKSFDKKAIEFLFKGKWNDFSVYTDLKFLIAIALGVGLSIISLAKVFEFLFDSYPILLWSFFFGLILASVYYVGRRVMNWNFQSILALLIGFIAAYGISVLSPGNENATFIYLFFCGIVGICSMILPGLSGSFILIIMGNYLLILNAISGFNLKILFPVAIGAVVGLVVFSNILSYIFREYHDITIALMTGFIFGSLNILWPWKKVLETFTKPNGEVVVLKYAKILPANMNTETISAVIIMIIGIFSIILLEIWAKKQQ